jgi:hypothetical protein
VTVEQGAPTCEADLGGQAVQGMRRDLRNKLILSNKSSRVCRDSRYDCTHAHAPAPAALPAHEVHAKKMRLSSLTRAAVGAPTPLKFLDLLVIKQANAGFEALLFCVCAY